MRPVLFFFLAAVDDDDDDERGGKGKGKGKGGAASSICIICYTPTHSYVLFLRPTYIYFDDFFLKLLRRTFFITFFNTLNKHLFEFFSFLYDH